MMQKAWIVSVDMGYGHQRTAFPLRHLAFEGKVIQANHYSGIPERDKKIWQYSKKFYEFVSRLKRIPLFGETIFFTFDHFQKIFAFYPKRDLSKPNFQLKQIYSLIKKGWGRDLIKRLKTQNSKLKTNLPIISTFFTPAFMAEINNYPGEIFCVVCDADIARTWAPLIPPKSKIKYFAPNQRVVERLKLYGVKAENIFLTGYPLPKENMGTKNLEILKRDLSHRILNLDPQKRYRKNYDLLIKKYVGQIPPKSNHPLTIMFAVGGAGAQKEIAIEILKSLKEKIEKKEVKIILVAGIRKKVKDYLEEKIKKLGLEDYIVTPHNESTPPGYVDKGGEILFEKDTEGYFQSFNSALRKTDILWTKPSELSFYCALGLPIIIAPPIGSQEDFNQEWLLRLGAGLNQENPAYADQWLFDLLDSGWFAEASLQGFIEGKKLGTFNIEKIISK